MPSGSNPRFSTRPPRLYEAWPKSMNTSPALPTQPSTLQPSKSPFLIWAKAVPTTPGGCGEESIKKTRIKKKRLQQRPTSEKKLEFLLRRGSGQQLCGRQMGPGQFLFDYMSLPLPTLILKPKMLILAKSSSCCYLTRLCNLKRAFKIPEIVRLTIAKIF